MAPLAVALHQDMTVVLKLQLVFARLEQWTHMNTQVCCNVQSSHV